MTTRDHLSDRDRQALRLAQDRRLGEIWGLGPRLITEIETSLVYAGFAVEHRHQHD